MKLNNGLTRKNCQKISALLNQLLANEYVLYTKTLNYHWNVTGPHFGPLHKLFNDQYEQLLSIADDVAERIRALGEHAHATLADFAALASVPEHPKKLLPALQMIADLVYSHEIVIRSLRPLVEVSDKLNDMGTNNFVSELLEKHEKIAWMLRAHLE